MGSPSPAELEARIVELERRLERRRGGRAVPALAAALVLTALSVPLAIAGEGADGERTATAAKKRGAAVQIQKRNRSRGETGLIANGNGYSLRLSNVKRGAGGGAIFGCRAAPGRESCVAADNLVDGQAFFFRSRKGSSAGHFQVDGPDAVPFTTNARGMVENLNAEMVGGLTAQELLSRAATDPVPGPPGEPGPQGEQGPRGEPGVTGLQYVSQDSPQGEEPGSPESQAVVVQCPAGKRILGGGARIIHRAGSERQVALTDSYPDTLLELWYAHAREMPTNDGNWYLRAHAVCGYVED